MNKNQLQQKDSRKKSRSHLNKSFIYVETLEDYIPWKTFCLTTKVKDLEGIISFQRCWFQMNLDFTAIFHFIVLRFIISLLLRLLNICSRNSSSNVYIPHGAWNKKMI